MKKFLLTALFMLSMAGISYAGGELRSTPRGDVQALATADYGGVFAATSSFSISGTTVCAPCSGVIHGAWFSTGTVNFATSLDFVDVYDSTSSREAYLGQTKGHRFYNNQLFNGSTNTASGFSGAQYPIRFDKGLIFRPSSVNYNNVNILYYQEP